MNDFLPREKKKERFLYRFSGSPSVKDALEAVGVPHTEVDVIIVNGDSVGFEYRLSDGDDIAVYPVFESFDVSSLTRLRKKSLRDSRFILDVHLGTLAKTLRLLGFDTYYRNDLDDDEIVDRAEREKRTILTRDIGILKQKRVTHGYWVRSTDSDEQAAEIIRRFQLENSARPFSRCPRCNGELKGADEAAIRRKVPENSRRRYSEFYECACCGQMYWKGSHFPKLLHKFRSLGINTQQFAL